MKQKARTGTYMRRLTWAARWQLTPAEAQTMLDDYEEILNHSSYSEDEIPGELSAPWQAARLLAEPRHYRRWLVVFTLLSACLLLPALSPAGPMLDLWELLRYSPFLQMLLFLLGLTLSFFWFQATGVRKAENKLPKGMLPLLLLLSAASLVTWAAIYLILFRAQELVHITQQMENGTFPYPLHPSQILVWILKSICFLSALAGEYGLIQARLADRRWRALYTLGITTCFLSLAILMALTSLYFPVDWRSSCMQSCILLTVAGLAGTGASLC